MKYLQMFGVAVIMTMLAFAAPVYASEVRLEAELVGAVMGGLEPSGKAVFRQKPEAMRLTVEVEDVNLAPGMTLMVWAGGQEVGSLVLDPLFLGGDLNLDTRDGEFVPSLGVGDMVQVMGPGGAVLTGVFHLQE